MSTPGRINPFLLPTSTNSLFILLAVLTVAAATQIAEYVLGGNLGWIQEYTACRAAARAQAGTAEPHQVALGFVDCTAAVDLARSAAAVGGVLGILALTGVGFLLHPLLVVRRGRLRVLGADPAGPLIDRLVAESGLRRPPTFLIDMRNCLGGRAFGRWPRYYIRLTLHTVARLRIGDPTAQALLRHELAHLRNRDVDLTALAIVAGWMTLLLALVPVGALLVRGQLGELGPLLLRLAVIAVGLALVRAMILRSREYDADVRASVGNVAAGHLAFDPAACPEPDPRRRLHRLRLLRDLHPSTASRRLMVEEPARLLRGGPAQAFAAGAVGSVATAYLLGPIGNIRGFYGQSYIITALVIGGIVAEVVMSGLWRSTAAALLAGRRPPRGLAEGCGLAAGLVVGDLAAVEQRFAPVTIAFRSGLAVGTAAVLATLLLSLLFCRWSVACAMAWLPATTGAGLLPTLNAARIVGVIAFGVASGTIATATWQAAARGRPEIIPYFTVAALVANPAICVAVAVAVAYPLAAALRIAPGRERDVGLDGPLPRVMPRLRLRPGLLVAVPVTVLVVVTAIDRWVIPGGLMNELSRRWMESTGDPTATWSFLGLGAAVALLVALVLIGVGLAAGGPSGGGLGPVHALLCALLTADAVAFGVLGLHVGSVSCADGQACGPADGLALLGALTLTLTMLVCVLAVVLSPLVSALNAVVRRRTGPMAAPRSPRRRDRWLAVAFAVVLLAGAAATAGSAYAGLRLNVGSIPLIGGGRPVEPPDPGPPVDMVTVCQTADRESQRFGWAELGQTGGRRQLGAMVMGAPDPAAAAIGRALRDADGVTQVSGENAMFESLIRWCRYPG